MQMEREKLVGSEKIIGRLFWLLLMLNLLLII